MTNTEIRAWLERAKTQPCTAGLALEMMPMMEDLLGEIDVTERIQIHTEKSLDAERQNAIITEVKLRDAESMLSDVVSELDLSTSAIEIHGPLGTPPSELVKLVLNEKDKKIAMLNNGGKIINVHSSK